MPIARLPNVDAVSAAGVLEAIAAKPTYLQRAGLDELKQRYKFAPELVAGAVLSVSDWSQAVAEGRAFAICQSFVTAVAAQNGWAALWCDPTNGKRVRLRQVRVSSAGGAAGFFLSGINPAASPGGTDSGVGVSLAQASGQGSAGVTHAFFGSAVGTPAFWFGTIDALDLPTGQTGSFFDAESSSGAFIAESNANTAPTILGAGWAVMCQTVNVAFRVTWIFTEDPN